MALSTIKPNQTNVVLGHLIISPGEIFVSLVISLPVATEQNQTEDNMRKNIYALFFYETIELFKTKIA